MNKNCHPALLASAAGESRFQYFPTFSILVPAARKKNYVALYYSLHGVNPIILHNCADIISTCMVSFLLIYFIFGWKCRC